MSTIIAEKENGMKKIGILGALSGEMAPVYSSLGELVGSSEFWGGTIYQYVDGDRAYYVALSGVGEIYAAAATQLLISEYKVEAILNFGLVGSLSSRFKIGDLVLVRTVVHHQFDLSGFGIVKKGIYDGRTSEFWDIDNDTLARVDAAIGEDLAHVVLASGDEFVSDKKTKDNIVKLFGAEICDMEGAGIVVTATVNKVPAILIKCVSDNADDAAGADYHQSVSDGIYHYKRLISAIGRAL